MSSAQSVTFQRSDARFGYTPDRACHVCDYGKTGECSRPECTGRQGSTVPFAAARQQFGPCGPDAFYLNFPGLYRPGEAP